MAKYIVVALHQTKALRTLPSSFSERHVAITAAHDAAERERDELNTVVQKLDERFVVSYAGDAFHVTDDGDLASAVAKFQVIEMPSDEPTAPTAPVWTLDNLMKEANQQALALDIMQTAVSITNEKLAHETHIELNHVLNHALDARQLARAIIARRMGELTSQLIEAIESKVRMKVACNIDLDAGPDGPKFTLSHADRYSINTYIS